MRGSSPSPLSASSRATAKSRPASYRRQSRISKSISTNRTRSLPEASNIQFDEAHKLEPFGNMTTVAAALIFRNSRILICQRRRDDTHGLQWEFPGGKVEI